MLSILPYHPTLVTTSLSLYKVCIFPGLQHDLKNNKNTETIVETPISVEVSRMFNRMWVI